MAKKQIKKKTKTGIALGSEESQELEMIVDRLAVQHPDGESFNRYLDSLRASLENRPGLAAALLDRLSKTPTETAFRVYMTLKGTAEASPTHRRALKHAAYRFSQRGFPVPEEAGPAEKVFLIPKETRRAITHYLPVERTLWFVSGLLPSGATAGHTFVSVFAEEEFKSVYARITESSAKTYREYLQSISGHLAGRKAVEIPPWHAARLFFDIRDFTGKEDEPDVARIREAFAPYYDPQRKPYAYDLMPEIEDPARRIPEVDFEKLLNDIELPWLRFSKEELAPFNQKIQELENPVLVIPKEVQMGRSLDVVRSAADALCAGKKRLLFQRFFEETAMYLKLSGNGEEALWAWIVAQHLAGGFKPSENQAVFQIVIYSLRQHWPEEFKKSTEEDRREQQQDPFRRTESGLILP